MGKISPRDFESFGYALSTSLRPGDHVLQQLMDLLDGPVTPHDAGLAAAALGQLPGECPFCSYALRREWLAGHAEGVALAAQVAAFRGKSTVVLGLNA